jgi:hypothetical protein
MQPVEEDPTANTNDTTLSEAPNAGDFVALDRCVDEALFHAERDAAHGKTKLELESKLKSVRGTR